MAVWQERGTLYKIGFIGVIVGSAIFIVGFCAPAWALYKMPTWASHQTQSMGLWQECTGDLSICKLSIDDKNPGWLKAVRALESVSMFFSVVACVIGLYCNCILKAQLSSSLFNKNVETSAIVSVVFGSFGLVIFSTQVQRYYDNHIGHISWAFVMVCASHSITGLSSFIMLISRRLMVASARQHLMHPHLHDNFPSTVNLPDYMQSDHVYITTMDGQMDMGPPAYETVVNCIPQEEPAPPPYEQVAQTQGCGQG